MHTNKIQIKLYLTYLKINCFGKSYVAQNKLNIIHALLYVACVESDKAATARSVILSRSFLVPDRLGFILGVFELLVPNNGTLRERLSAKPFLFSGIC